jgi:hypothetical protein
VPWGQLWNDYEFEILLELSGCHKLTCTYYELIKDPFNSDESVFECETKDRITNNPEVISHLGLDIQRFEFQPQNTYRFLCNGAPITGGGIIEFTADSYRIFDNTGKEISYKHMSDWFEEFWKNDEVK